jgi:DNA invertase Pin-like site-specific DNA recombinase
MPAAVRRIAIYLRRSTDDEHQPFSISAQEAALLNYIASQSGWTLVAKYSDDASGATTGRPDLQRALQAARAGRFDVLLVVRVDRFSRRLSDLLALLAELDDAGVAFVSATEPFDTSTSIGRMLVQLLGMFAEFERETIIDRVTKGMAAKAAKAAKGKWPGGTRPYGYWVDRDTHKLVPHPEEAPHLKEIFQLYADERLGTRAIAAELNCRGVRNRTGKPWAPRSTSSRPATTRSPTPSATSPPHPRPTPSSSSAPTCTTSSTPAPPPSAKPPSKPSSPRSASPRKESSPCSESQDHTAPSPEKPAQPAPARSRFAQWFDRWGGWGSNPRPADYESAALTS